MIAHGLVFLRSAPRLRADRARARAGCVPVGYDSRARARAVSNVRQPTDRRPIARDRRIRSALPETLRRHRFDRERDRRARLRQRPRPSRDRAHERDPRTLQDRQQRLPLRAVHVRARADPLERAVRLAHDDRARARGVVLVLARGWGADGHLRHSRKLRRARAVQRRLRARRIPFHGCEPARGGRDARDVRALVPGTAAAARPPLDPRVARPASARGVRARACIAVAPTRDGRGAARTRARAALAAQAPARAVAHRDPARGLSERLSHRIARSAAA